MSYFYYENNELKIEEVVVTEIVKRYGTPCYIYSHAAIENAYRQLDQAFGQVPHQIYYAVKANSNLAVLNLLAKIGSGFDIVSVGELERVLASGGAPDKIVFSGVGKRDDEIARALDVGIHCFHVESEAELTQLQTIAATSGKIARVTLRINPDVDAGTHPYIATGLKENKFGVAIEQVQALYQKIVTLPNLAAIGLACHIGSQITELDPFLAAMDQLVVIFDELAAMGIPLHYLDMGGGLAVRYQHEIPPSASSYIHALTQKLGSRKLTLSIEPGRSIVANAGILVTQVLSLKDTSQKNFAIVDCAMNDLIRPALYDAWQTIVPLTLHLDEPEKMYDIVGPVCESGDFLGKNRSLSVRPHDFLAIQGAGAYGFTMSSNYNSRPRAAEVLVNKSAIHLIRERETIKSLFALEHIPS